MNRLAGLAVTVGTSIMIFGCHHAPPKTEVSGAKGAPEAVEKPVAESGAVPDGNPMAGPVPSRDRILTSYSLLQLDSAANAYKVTSDETMGRSIDTPPPALFGCPVKGSIARGAILPLKELIDAKVSREQGAYVRTPGIYLKTRDVAHCEKTCSCGVFLDVMASLDVRVLKRNDQNHHEEMLLQLQSKASRQGPGASLECAKKQNWICGSDLEKYVYAHQSVEK